MEIYQNITSSQQPLHNSDAIAESKQTLPQEFERLFARQLVQELTKGLFENEEGALPSGSGNMYKQQIVDVLSSELANQQKLGIADAVEHYLAASQKAGNEQQLTKR